MQRYVHMNLHSFQISSPSLILQPPLMALPDMTNARVMVGPPGFAPPKNFDQRLRTDESMGFVVRRGTAKIMGYSRRKPAEELNRQRR
ncbi:hypothetical protein TELCIR_20655 [Teladorsagia circumcincta]|uniref:Uncharacterized protein n=1 Tax=Teladorsagia circumcincta TaxID=45464 RepID=A0A2G9TIV9_TELCI|nr:hypothetical protein TELCIR_20655 [Teladorsagia circumcincta]